MAKNKILLCAALWLCAVHYSFGDWTLREQVVNTAEAEIGVKEETGNNDGERIAEYLAISNLKGNYPWCAAFIAWVFHECGLKAPVSAWCPDWFEPRKVVYYRGGKRNRTPQPGDVFGIWFNDKGRIAHCGLIHSIDGDRVTTIEGNTNPSGGREGDGVYKKFRLMSQMSKVSDHISH